MVIVALPAPPEIDVGLKLTVTPLGAPEADKEIAELNPPMLVVVIVDMPELPVATLTAVGDADTVKSEVLDTCWVMPRNARPVLAPGNTVSFVPDKVICRVVLLDDQAAADHALPLASAKNPAAIPGGGTVSTNNDVLPSRNSMLHPVVHGG
jgi:hypothetical protein